MGVLDYFDPTGNNFLGLGKYMGRGLGDIATMGQGEWFRPDPYGMGRNTIGGQIGHGAGGAMQGAAGGFMTGGIPGAVMGGATGGVRSGLGDSSPWTLAGQGGGGTGNFGIGAGEGALYSGGHALMAGGPASGSAPTQGSPMSPVSKALNMMRGMTSQPPQQAPQQDLLSKIYAMYPNLRPHLGGSYGS